MILQPSYDAKYNFFYFQNVFIIIFCTFSGKMKKKTGKMYNSDVLFV